MIVFLNGKFVPEERAVVSVFDRGFLYGDALYEGILVSRGKLFRWVEHMERLQNGVDFLKLTVPFTTDQLLTYARELIKRNKMPECLLRLTISRGITERGYSPKNAKNPAVVMTLHLIPPTKPLWDVIISSFRIPADDPLTLFKTANKVRQVLARAEADVQNAQESILLNTRGHIAEGTTSNVFWIKKNIVYTPALPEGALPGVTRAVVMEICARMKISVRETQSMPKVLLASDGAFLTMSSFGVVEMASLNGRKLRLSPLVPKLRETYQKLIASS